MTVADFIKLLSIFPPEMEVLRYDCACEDCDGHEIAGEPFLLDKDTTVTVQEDHHAYPNGRFSQKKVLRDTAVVIGSPEHASRRMCPNRPGERCDRVKRKECAPDYCDELA